MDNTIHDGSTRPLGELISRHEALEKRESAIKRELDIVREELVSTKQILARRLGLTGFQATQVIAPARRPYKQREPGVLQILSVLKENGPSTCDEIAVLIGRDATVDNIKSVRNVLDCLPPGFVNKDASYSPIKWSLAVRADNGAKPNA